MRGSAPSKRRRAVLLLFFVVALGGLAVGLGRLLHLLSWMQMQALTR